MKIEKHLEILREVDETIAQALSSGSLLSYQRRIMAMLSLGIQQLVEIHFRRLQVIRPGTQIKHEWFGMGSRNLRTKLAAVLTTDIGKVPNIWEIIELAQSAEAERNDIIYGSPLADDRKIREKIDAYLEMKKIIMESYGTRY